MVCHSTIKADIHQSIGNVDSSGEDLVQVSTQLVGNSALVHGMGEVKLVELPIHVVDVVVKISTHHDRSFGILLDDILDDISDPLRSLLLELFLSRLEVAIKDLHLMLSSRQPYPAEISAQRFDKRHFDSVGCCCPRSSVPLQHCLVTLIVFEIHRYRQLVLVKAENI